MLACNNRQRAADEFSGPMPVFSSIAAQFLKGLEAEFEKYVICSYRNIEMCVF
jgi:hypothetical protein